MILADANLLLYAEDAHFPLHEDARGWWDGQASAGLSLDAHLGTLAVEHGCLLCSTDANVSRFRGVKWANPLMA